MTKDELIAALNSEDQFKEIWIYGQSGQSICALINGDVGWLMYLRWSGDAGYSTRNPDESSKDDIEYMLSNGQMDYYPKKWAYPIVRLKQALCSFIDNGELPDQLTWHDDSSN
ncbi:MAG: Imm1 family immunity protein [Pseudomonadota bacterium]|nr:Imm1 family immunity protein [Pseudomonadota bacterium]